MNSLIFKFSLFNVDWPNLTNYIVSFLDKDNFSTSFVANSVLKAKSWLLELSYVAGRNIKGYNHFRKLTFSYKVKYTPTLWSSHSTPGYLPKVNESIEPQEDRYKSIYDFIHHNSSKMETTKLYINRWMNKQLPYNLFIHQ